LTPARTSENRSSKNELRTRLQTEASSAVLKKPAMAKWIKGKTEHWPVQQQTGMETDRKLLATKISDLEHHRGREQHKKNMMQKEIFH
jgi:hypothetical protein